MSSNFKLSEDGICISAVVGIFGAIFAVLVTPQIPLPAIYVILGFCSFLALLLCYKLIIRVRIKFSLAAKRPPTYLHADWDATALAEQLSNTDLDNLTPSLKHVEEIALQLLIADRLETGGWSKTQTWRFVRPPTPKPLSPIGTLTGTFFSVDALKPYGYQNSSEANHLAQKLNDVIMLDGRVKLRLQPTGAGTMELVDENLRHSSAWLLLRASSGAFPSPADRNCLLNITKKLKDRLEPADGLGPKVVNDMMGTAFAIVALIAAESWFSKPDQKLRELVKLSFQMFSESVELRTPGHTAWAAEPGGSAAAETAAQWVTVWLLSSISDWHGLGSSHRACLIDNLLDLIEANITSVNNSNSLLPHAYSRDSMKTPKGESLFATAIACYAAMIVLNDRRSPVEMNRAEKIINDLLHRIAERGEEYATFHALNDPYEGYLAWGAVLLALRPFLHPGPFVSAIQPEELWSGGVENLDEGGVCNACNKIQFMYKESGATLKSNGLFQEL